ncbi:hypothetical protein BDR03DRAFT_935713 [Suillus americanus]|nr:hypothetical protein BDR03DRAFT_935713 [Suillus americanus]
MWAAKRPGLCIQEYFANTKMMPMNFVLPSSRRLDTHDCSGRIELLASDWASQYEVLMDTLLNYMHDPMEPPSSDNETDHFCIPNGTSDRCLRIFKHVSPFINVSLLCYGCIGSSPIRLTIAITIHMLDIIHVEAKMLCFLHGVYYCRHLAEQLCISYDVYLELYWCIDHCLDKVLGHNSDNWWMLNLCPACQYKLTDGPPLEFSILCACDSNNSANCESYIDAFKDEVHSTHTHKARDQCPVRDPDNPWVDEPDSVDSAEPHTVCVDHWRNAAPKSQKKMFTIFKIRHFHYCVPTWLPTHHL